MSIATWADFFSQHETSFAAKNTRIGKPPAVEFQVICEAAQNGSRISVRPIAGERKSKGKQGISKERARHRIELALQRAFDWENQADRDLLFFGRDIRQTESEAGWKRVLLLLRASLDPEIVTENGDNSSKDWDWFVQFPDGATFSASYLRPHDKKKNPIILLGDVLSLLLIGKISGRPQNGIFELTNTVRASTRRRGRPSKSGLNSPEIAQLLSDWLTQQDIHLPTVITADHVSDRIEKWQRSGAWETKLLPLIKGRSSAGLASKAACETPDSKRSAALDLFHRIEAARAGDVGNESPRSTIQISNCFPEFNRQLRKLWPDSDFEITVTPQFVVGRIDFAGGSQPFESSAANLLIHSRVNDDLKASCFIPWPSEPDLDRKTGSATSLFVHQGLKKVFPFIRMRIEETEKDSKRWRYFDLDAWWAAAIGEWRVIKDSKSNNRVTLIEHLVAQRRDPEPQIIEHQLWAIAKELECSIAGRKRSRVQKEELPAWWLHIQDTVTRPATDFKLHVERSSVITAKKPSEKRPKKASTEKALRNAPPTSGDGVDPYHIPEVAVNRSELYLGSGVKLHRVTADSSDQIKLKLNDRNLHSLSPSTSRIPFAGYNDPRRLLLGAKIQPQAVELNNQEQPLVISGLGENRDPAGTNLRVGYLAWAGWNHEDAWVISESAAQEKLVTRERVIQSLAFATLEAPATPLKQVGEGVINGELLVHRAISPLNLRLSWEQLSQWLDKQGQQEGRNSMQELVTTLSDSTLEPADSDKALCNGIIVGIEVWDFVSNTLTRQDRSNSQTVQLPYRISGDVRARYRQLLRFEIEQRRPLRVGDKLANRHGHKGVVGLILADKHMPRWNGLPLEALIDPISVVNRGNWGQFYETLAGAVARRHGKQFNADATSIDPAKTKLLQEFRDCMPRDTKLASGGRSQIQPAEDAIWMHKPIFALAGEQFVMRLPKYAENDSSKSRKPANFDLFRFFALCAHGLKELAVHPTRPLKLTQGAEQLREELSLAGWKLDLAHERSQIWLRSLPLSKRSSETQSEGLVDAPSTFVQLRLLPRELKFKWRSVGQGQAKRKKLKKERASVSDQNFEVEAERVLQWIPLDNPTTEFVTGQRQRSAKNYRELRSHLNNFDTPLKSGDRTSEVIRLIKNVLFSAYRAAVGSGESKSKSALYYQNVLRRECSQSGRRVVAPAGLWEAAGSDKDSLYKEPDVDVIGLDEVLLPKNLMRLATRDGQSKLVWLSRDPVLHRWSLLASQPRESAHSVIRLPAGILPVLGADFDGDDIAVFPANVMGVDESQTPQFVPSKICCHDFRKDDAGRPQIMFGLSKQYLYGLRLLLDDPVRWRDLRERLKQERGAPDWPDWPDGLPTKDRNAWLAQELGGWFHKVGKAEQKNGRWWAIVETFALRALADNPGMDCGICLNIQEVVDLPPASCGAAKKESYLASNSLMNDILAGRSLELIKRGVDPIARVMLTANYLKGPLGNAVKDLIYAAIELTDSSKSRDFVRAAQTLTERIQQRVLSIKSGGEVPTKKMINNHILAPLLKGVDMPDEDGDDPIISELRQLMRIVAPTLKPFLQTSEDLNKQNVAKRHSWRQWLLKPNLLPLLPLEQFVYELPLTDIRTWLFLELGPDR